MVEWKGKIEPALDYFCPILPYVRFYPTLPELGKVNFTLTSQMQSLLPVNWHLRFQRKILLSPFDCY